MTPRQVEMIRTSWTAVEPIADVAATLFYDRLFEQDPAIRRMFRSTDMAAQKKNLMQTLAVVVRSLDRLEDLVPAVQALGRRHGGYGVRPAHYDMVGGALLWTLGQGLGDAFTLQWFTRFGRTTTSQGGQPVLGHWTKTPSEGVVSRLRSGRDVES